MKHQVSVLSFALLIFAAVAFSTYAQNNKEDKGKGNQKEQGKGNNKDDQGKGNNDNKGSADNRGKGNNNNGNNGNSNDDRGKGDDKNDNKDNGKGNDNDNEGDRNDKKVKFKEGFKWDDETFRDRDNILRNTEKVTICHKPGKGNKPGVTIRVSEAALQAHMNHGDVTGECPNTNNGNFSDDYLRRRTNYFEVLQNGQEQVLYSRSILDYAVQRLTGARTQLVTLQQTNAPAEDVERRKMLVVELEDNVSVLRTLLGVTANLVVNKLTD